MMGNLEAFPFYDAVTRPLPVPTWYSQSSNPVIAHAYLDGYRHAACGFPSTGLDLAAKLPTIYEVCGSCWSKTKGGQVGN